MRPKTWSVKPLVWCNAQRCEGRTRGRADFSDKYAPFHSKVVNVGVRDSTYVLDGPGVDHPPGPGAVFRVHVSGLISGPATGTESLAV